VQLLEVLTACLSVLCGATLPPDCLTVYALTETMCGASLFPTLATFLEVQADPNVASPALRIRAHAVAALTYLLPLLNVQEEWTSVRHVVDTLGFAAATSFETLSANSVASTSMQRLFSASLFTITNAAVAAVTQQTGGVEAFQDSELFTIHSAIVRTALRCLRYMVIVGDHVKVGVSLGSLPTASAAALAAHAVIEHSPGIADAEVAALTAEAIASNQDVQVKASEYILCATTALEVIAGCLHQTGPMFDMIRDAALCFLVSCVKNGTWTGNLQHASKNLLVYLLIAPMQHTRSSASLAHQGFSQGSYYVCMVQRSYSHALLLCYWMLSLQTQTVNTHFHSRAYTLVVVIYKHMCAGASCRLLLQRSMPTELAKPLTGKSGCLSDCS
jgi:hypothetical protein